jgi:hypothetical protein
MDEKSNTQGKYFTEIGIATSEGKYKGRDAIFVVQFFGEPKTFIPALKTDSLSVVTPEPEIVVINEEKTEDSSLAIVSNGEEQEEVVLGVESANTSSIDVSWWQKVLASPKTSLAYVLSVFALLMTVALLLKVFVKIKIQYPSLVINGVLVLAIIISLLYINHALFNVFTSIA